MNPRMIEAIGMSEDYPSVMFIRDSNGFTLYYRLRNGVLYPGRVLRTLTDDGGLPYLVVHAAP